MHDTKILIDNGVDLQKSLELFGDMETYDDNLDEFLNGVESRLDDLNKFKQSGDMNNYSIIVHSIKSDAKYFGFTKLAELALNHELKSKANDMYYITDNYEELMNEIYRITNLVKDYMGWENKKKEVVVNTNKTDTAILVVDDSNIISNFVTKIFNNEYEVITASDGSEAISMLSNMTQQIAGMLLDLNMPNVNGYQVVNFMQVNNLFKDINVAIITGTNSSEVLEKVKDYPIKAILEKPFNEVNVKKVVEMITKK